MTYLLAGGLAAGAALTVFACDDTPSDEGDSPPTGVLPCEPTLASIIDTIFLPTCTGSGCHSGADSAAGLDFTLGGLEARLVDQAAATCDRILVVPGDPAASFLHEKVTSDALSCGVPMPIGQKLADSQIAC